MDTLLDSLLQAVADNNTTLHDFLQYIADLDPEDFKSRVAAVDMPPEIFADVTNQQVCTIATHRVTGEERVYPGIVHASFINDAVLRKITQQGYVYLCLMPLQDGYEMWLVMDRESITVLWDLHSECFPDVCVGAFFMGRLEIFDDKNESVTSLH